MRRPSTTALIGAVSTLLLIGGGAWVLVDGGSDSSTRDAARTATSPDERLDEQVLPADATEDGADGGDEGEVVDLAGTGEESTVDTPPDEPQRTGPLAGVTVAIDPGHNGGNGAAGKRIARLVDAGGLRKACDTVGTSAPSGLTEAAYALRVARRVRAHLRSVGATVLMTRADNDGVGPCIDRRATLTNRADVAVSIHADGDDEPGARGFHVIVGAPTRARSQENAMASLRLGIELRTALAKLTRVPVANYVADKGLDVRDDIGGLNRSTVPKVLVETGNMHNARDMRILGTTRGQNEIAKAIALGIARYVATRE